MFTCIDPVSGCLALSLCLRLRIDFLSVCARLQRCGEAEPRRGLFSAFAQQFWISEIVLRLNVAGLWRKDVWICAVVERAVEKLMWRNEQFMVWFFWWKLKKLVLFVAISVNWCLLVEKHPFTRFPWNSLWHQMVPHWAVIKMFCCLLIFVHTFLLV